MSSRLWRTDSFRDIGTFSSLEAVRIYLPHFMGPLHFDCWTERRTTLLRVSGDTQVSAALHPQPSALPLALALRLPLGRCRTSPLPCLQGYGQPSHPVQFRLLRKRDGRRRYCTRLSPGPQHDAHVFLAEPLLNGSTKRPQLARNLLIPPPARPAKSRRWCGRLSLRPWRRPPPQSRRTGAGRRPRPPRAALQRRCGSPAPPGPPPRRSAPGSVRWRRLRLHPCRQQISTTNADTILTFLVLHRLAGHHRPRLSRLSPDGST